MRTEVRKSRVAERADAIQVQSRSELIRAAIFLTSGALAVIFFALTTVTVNRMSTEIATTSEMLARLCAQGSFTAVRDSSFDRILRDVISRIDFPIVITDRTGVPRAWRNVGIAPEAVPDSLLERVASGLAVPEEPRHEIERLRTRAGQLDRAHAPIPMTNPVLLTPLGHLHYGDPPVLAWLRLMPYVSVGGLLLVVSLGWWGLTAVRRAERRSIWVGMALETAHQLGTPLSSLMGWIELLRGRVEMGSGDEIRLPRGDTIATLDDMERDVDRLTKIAQRFSHVGSAPRLVSQDLGGVVSEAVEYMRRRLPKQESGTQIRERYETVPPVPCDRELLAWVIENLLSNAVNAIEQRPGRIEVVMAPAGQAIEIEVRDNGRGMTPTEQRRAFEPGYTTRKRGWGLGLALARRVVEEYHGGRLLIRRSVPGEGTVVAIVLPR